MLQKSWKMKNSVHTDKEISQCNILIFAEEAHFS